MLDDELLQILRVVFVRQGCGCSGCGFSGVLQDCLQVGGQSVVLVFVENNFKEFLGLVEGTHGVKLGHVLCTKAHVGCGVVEFEGVNHTALHGRHNFAAWQLSNGHAHFLQHVGSQTNGAVLEAFQVGRLFGW